jgi:RNA polymerase sigma factor (sigma-70 family)
MGRCVKKVGTAAQHALALQIARSFARNVPPNVDRGDIDQAALIGLWDGLTRRGPDADVPYLRFRIRGSIRDELRRQDWLPRRARKTRQRLDATILHFDDVGPDAEERVQAAGESPEDLLIEKRALEELRAAPLPPRLRRVLDMYLAGQQLTDVAAALGVSQPRASQLYWRAIQVIRAAVRAPTQMERVSNAYCSASKSSESIDSAGSLSGLERGVLPRIGRSDRIANVCGDHEAKADGARRKARRR